MTEKKNFVPLDDIGKFEGIQFELEGKDEIVTKYAETQVLNGEVVPVCLGAVYALIADGASPEAVEKAYVLKNRPKDKPFGVLLDFTQVSNLIDLDQVPQVYHALFTSTEGIQELEELFGNKGFIRFPVKEGQNLHPSLLKDGALQAFTFKGDEIAFNFEERIRRSLQEKHPDNHGEILVTSYNLSGTESITDRTAAAELTRDKDIFLQINRPDTTAEGSYSIYSLTQEGFTKVREGTGSIEIDAALNLS